MGLVFSISQFFITKMARANKWMRKKVPSYSNSSLFAESAHIAVSKIFKGHFFMFLQASRTTSPPQTKKVSMKKEPAETVPPPKLPSGGGAKG